MTYKIIIVLRYNLNNNNNSNFIDIRKLFAEYYQQNRNIIPVLSASIKLTFHSLKRNRQMCQLDPFRELSPRKFSKALEVDVIQHTMWTQFSIES